MDFTGQPFDESSPVSVYWNLHRHRFSVKQRGLVVAHADSLDLRHVSYRVGAAGNQQVRDEKRKHVHATMHGYLGGPESPGTETPVTYNPYKDRTFVTLPGRLPIFASDSATLRTSNKRPLVISIKIPK